MIMENARVLNRKELVELVLTNLTVSISENVEFQRELFITEYWRRLLHDLASKEHSEVANNNIKPVRTRRIKRMLLQYLETIWPELRDERSQNQTDVVATVCNRLEQIGDIVRLRNGYFLPAPLRLIELPESQYSVIVGGISTETIRLLLPDAMIAGYGRIIEKQKIPDSIKRDRGWWQEYTNWIGWKPDDVENWVKMQIGQLSSSGSQSIQDFEEFEVYNASGNRKSSNRSLWINQSSILAQGVSGTWFCKTTDSNKRRYFLGEFKDGRLLKELTISGQDTRLWLMLGLRVCNGHFPSARWNNNYLKVIPQLPRAIECHVLIFSFKQNAYEYYVSEQFHSHVEQLLKSYGYQFPGRRRTKDE